MHFARVTIGGLYSRNVWVLKHHQHIVKIKPKANETLNFRTAHILNPESFKTAETVISVCILEYFYFTRGCDTTKYITHV